MISSPSPASRLSSKSAHSDLLDQTALSTLAQRLVEAAKRAGADAADAVAVRGVSQGVEVRDGRVEAYAIGPAESLTALRQTLERGPKGASVTGVTEEDATIEPNYAAAFSIEYDA